MPQRGLEVCANSLASALAAQEGGAIRVELCDNLAEGGTTPSFAQIALAKDKLNIEVWPIIRPRGGDFLFTEPEYEIMKEDVKVCKALGCDGVVVGLLLADGNIDKQRTAELIALAKPMPVAFHRAFDRSNDLAKALGGLIELGVIRVLTSGGYPTAIEGTDVLAQLIKQANGRIEIMPGSGVNSKNITELIRRTGATQYHASAKVAVISAMKYINPNMAESESYELTSANKVKELVQAINTSA